MEEQRPLAHKVVCFQMLDFETSKSKSDVSKSNSWKITDFLKTTSLQWEQFFILPTSPHGITRYQVRFMLMTILSNDQ